MSPSQELLVQFTDALCEHHLEQLRAAADDDELRDAIVIKLTALTALAFDLPPTRGMPLDTDEALEKLRGAIAVIARSKRRAR